MQRHVRSIKQSYTLGPGGLTLAASRLRDFGITLGLKPLFSDNLKRNKIFSTHKRGWLSSAEHVCPLNKTFPISKVVESNVRDTISDQHLSIIFATLLNINSFNLVHVLFTDTISFIGTAVNNMLLYTRNWFLILILVSFMTFFCVLIHVVLTDTPTSVTWIKAL